MAFVYILYSQKNNRFYIGSCIDVKLRLHQHATKTYKNAYTAKVDDWVLIYKQELNNITIARKIENHIKNMKSTDYIKNLIRYPEIMSKLIERFNTGSCR